MKLTTKLLAVKALLKLMLLGKRTPLLVGWALTNRCNLRCKYCNTWSFESRELSIKEIFSIIDELSVLGCARIAFTGGEPLLRNDIQDIISYSKDKRIYTGINSNGILVPEKIAQIKHIDLLMLSLDGPQETHDYLRGRGSYKSTLTAIDTAVKHNLKIATTTVLTKHNLNYVDFILEKAKFFNSYAYFQPVTTLPLGAGDIRELLPSQPELKAAIQKILALKKENNLIGNSKGVLEHYLGWPDCKEIRCKAGQIYCAIDPEGFLYACSNLRKSDKSSILNSGFKGALNSLNKVSCRSCWCSSPLEINKLLSFDINSILNALRTQA